MPTFPACRACQPSLVFSFQGTNLGSCPPSLLIAHALINHPLYFPLRGPTWVYAHIPYLLHIRERPLSTIPCMFLEGDQLGFMPTFPAYRTSGNDPYQPSFVFSFKGTNLGSCPYCLLIAHALINHPLYVPLRGPTWAHAHIPYVSHMRLSTIPCIVL